MFKVTFLKVSSNVMELRESERDREREREREKEKERERERQRSYIMPFSGSSQFETKLRI